LPYIGSESPALHCGAFSFRENARRWRVWFTWLCPERTAAFHFEAIMSAAELAMLQPGADLYVRVTLVENFGDDLVVKFTDPRGSRTIQIGAGEVMNFAPLTLKRSGQQTAMRLCDVDLLPGASTWARANAKR
jgi:hypothetical protein